MAMYENVADALGGGGLPPWQHPKTLNRKDAEKLFLLPGNNVEGAFLVRESAKRPGDFALSVMLSGKPQHYVIKSKGGTFSIDDGPAYDSLSGLVDYYMHDPSSPTRIVKPVCRPGTEASSASSPGGAAPPPLRPRTSTGTSQQGAISTPQNYENVDDVLANSPPAPAPRSPRTARSPPRDTGADTASSPPAANQSTGGASQSRVEYLRNKQNQVGNIDIAEREVQMSDGAQTANYLAVQFEKEAHLTEKLHLFWVNQKLEKMKSDKRIENVTDDLKDGVIVMELIAELSGKKALRHTKKPRSEVQIVDNWTTVVKFMKSIGIQVDADGDRTDQESVWLDAKLLATMDRREHLKLFSKLMLFENGL